MLEPRGLQGGGLQRLLRPDSVKRQEPLLTRAFFFRSSTLSQHPPRDAPNACRYCKAVSRTDARAAPPQNRIANAATANILPSVAKPYWNRIENTSEC